MSTTNSTNKKAKGNTVPEEKKKVSKPYPFKTIFWYGKDVTLSDFDLVVAWNKKYG